MAREKLDALVCRLPENVLLLTGYWPICGWAFAVLSSSGDAACIVPDTETREAEVELAQTRLVTYPFGTKEQTDQLQSVRNALASLNAGRQWRRIGFEGSFETAAPAGNAAECFLPAARSRRVLSDLFGVDSLVDVTEVLETEKAVKTPHEAAGVARASRIACIGMVEFQRRVDAGVSGVQLVAAVESAIMTGGTGFEGARRVRAFAQVATGPE
jgi:Xaa-Pro aminopeptidase